MKKMIVNMSQTCIQFKDGVWIDTTCFRLLERNGSQVRIIHVDTDEILEAYFENSYQARNWVRNAW